MLTAKLVFLPFIFITVSCATTQRTDLFFGMSVPDGTHVTQEQWKQFSDSVVASEFPEGYTEFDAKGKWMDTNSKQTITEPTKVLSFIGKKTKERQIRLNTVTQYYIQKYKQQAVLRVDTKTSIRFENSN